MTAETAGRPWGRPTRLAAGFLALLLAVLGLGACAPRPAPVLDGPAPGLPLYVLSDGWHSGLLLPRAAVDPVLWPEGAALGPHQYVEVGWGDRDAYRADRLTPRLALAAAFRSGGSALFLSGHDRLPLQEGWEVVELRLPQAAWDRLVRFVGTTHVRDEAGRAVVLGPGFGRTSTFYAARGRYHVFHTCNTWVARALAAAGLPVSPRLVLTATQLMPQIRGLGQPLGPVGDEEASSLPGEAG